MQLKNKNFDEKSSAKDIAPNRQADQRRRAGFADFSRFVLLQWSGAECAIRRREAATTCIYGHVLRSLSYFSKFLDEKFGALSSLKNTQKKY